MSIAFSQKDFGSYDGVNAIEYTLQNSNGMSVGIMNFGATVTKIIAPDKSNKYKNVIIGFKDIDGYLQNADKYIGCTAGRFCNRIANATFSIDGIPYKLYPNNRPHHLQGGRTGFNKVWWTPEKNEEKGTLSFHYTSKDGEEGYPGNLAVQVIYTLNENNALKIEFIATTDKTTVVNLTNHAYFNLTGDAERDILSHELYLDAGKYTAVDSKLIPTGELPDVRKLAYDFTSPKKIGRDIGQIPRGGYDLNFVLNKSVGKSIDGIPFAGSVVESSSGRIMEIYTTQPGIQFYNGSFVSQSKQYYGFCLETQHFPDSPNQPAFPITLLKPGQTFQESTVYQFAVVS